MVDIDRSIIGQEFDRTDYGPIAADELIAFARALGALEPEYTQPGPKLVAHPSYVVRFRGRKFYPENLPQSINVRSGFDAGKDVALGVPIRPGDSCTVHATLHEIYEKTGRSGSMVFVVIRFTITNQRGELVGTVDNRFMHRSAA